MEQVKIYGKVDEGIRPWVEFLLAHGFRTFYSCQGSPLLDHANRIPTIKIYADIGATVEATVTRLVALVGGDLHTARVAQPSSTMASHIVFHPHYVIAITPPAAKEGK